jgi:hypothetical protein
VLHVAASNFSSGQLAHAVELAQPTRRRSPRTHGLPTCASPNPTSRRSPISCRRRHEHNSCARRALPPRRLIDRPRS